MKGVWVNVYEVTREYGGPEEGGWWYNWVECIDARYVPVEGYAETAKKKLEEEYGYVKRGNIYSVLGGAELYVMVEGSRASRQSLRRPHYE